MRPCAIYAGRRRHTLWASTCAHDNHLPSERWVTPKEFSAFERALELIYAAYPAHLGAELSSERARKNNAGL